MESCQSRIGRVAAAANAVTPNALARPGASLCLLGRTNTKINRLPALHQCAASRARAPDPEHAPEGEVAEHHGAALDRGEQEDCPRDVERVPGEAAVGDDVPEADGEAAGGREQRAEEPRMAAYPS